MNKDIEAYNDALAAEDQKIAEILSREIEAALPDAESKLYHSHPAWFLGGNPLVGYSKLKDHVQLLFWSGQSFEEKGLIASGNFKASEARYSNAAEIDMSDLAQWLEKARAIQWNYKDIVKNKGALERLS